MADPDYITVFSGGQTEKRLILHRIWRAISISEGMAYARNVIALVNAFCKCKIQWGKAPQRHEVPTGVLWNPNRAGHGVQLPLVMCRFGWLHENILN